MIESACWCVYLLEEGFKRSRWAIGSMGSGQSMAIWALCWHHDTPDHRRRTQCPDNPFRCCGDGHGKCAAYSNPMMWCMWIPMPRMRWRPPRPIVGCMRQLPGLIQHREPQTLQVPTFQWWMNHLNDCFHCWHCASSSCKEYLFLCCNGIPLQGFNRLYLWISNTVAYRDTENGSMAIGKGQVYMPHKYSWGKFKVSVVFNYSLDDQFRSASVDLQQLTLWIWFTGHNSMAYDKWEWKIHHWVIKSTRHSLPSPRWPSTIACWPRKQASLGSSQSLVQEVELNVSAIHETFITWLLMHAQMYFIVSTQIFVLPHSTLKPKW